MSAHNEEPFSEALQAAIVAEMKRRGMRVSASCTFCGEVFLKQEGDYLIKHRKYCRGNNNGGSE